MTSDEVWKEAQRIFNLLKTDRSQAFSELQKLGRENGTRVIDRIHAWGYKCEADLLEMSRLSRKYGED